MQYILDFDHTLYNTDLFVSAAGPYRESGLWVTPAIWDILDSKDFFYDDSIQFLKRQQKEHVRILTAMTPSLGPESCEFQKVKVERSGVQTYVSDTIYMEGDKGSFIAEMYDGSPTVFVDDRIDHLLSAKKHCHEILVVQMVRPGLEGKIPTAESEGVPVVNSLSALEALFQK